MNKDNKATKEAYKETNKELNPSGQNIAYIRVSTVDQNEARQLEALKDKGIDKWYIEKVSGKDMNRPKLQEMLDYVREGDTIYIMDFSRISRSVKDLLGILDLLETKKVRLVSLKEALDTKTPTGRLMLTMIGAINEFERANLKERQAEGIAIAKEEGKYKGRKKVEVSEEFIEGYNKYLNRELSKSALAKLLNVSRPTLNKLIEEYKIQIKEN